MVISEREDNGVSWSAMIVRYSGACVWLLTNSHATVMGEGQNNEIALRWLRVIPRGYIVCPAARCSVHTLSLLWFHYACNGVN